MNFINLTNGIEAILDLPSGWQVIRIQSTTVEKKDWPLLFQDLDHNILFRLARGEDCHIYDFGTLRPISKIVFLAIPLIVRVLNKVWLNKNSEDTLFVSVYQNLIARAEDRDSQQAKKKLCYYRRWLNTDTIKLFGHSRSTKHDGDIEFFKNILRERGV